VTIQINKLKKAININQSIAIIAINGKCEELIISAGNIFYILKTPCDKISQFLTLNCMPDMVPTPLVVIVAPLTGKFIKNDFRGTERGERSPQKGVFHFVFRFSQLAEKS